MKKKKAKVTERIITINREGGNLNGVPYIQFLVAMQGLEALNRGMMLTRVATPSRCMEIISQITGNKYKRTDRNKALYDAEVIMHALREEKRQKAEDEFLAKSS